MARLMLVRLTIPFALAGCVALACGDDDPETTPTGSGGAAGDGGGSPDASAGSGGDEPGSGGAVGSGGASSSGGAVGSGGAAPMFDSGALYTCIARQEDPDNNPDPGGEVASGEDCCGGLGTCTATADLTDDSASGNYGFSDCVPDMDMVCAPKPNDELPLPDGGMLPTCTTTIGNLDLEGRCLPSCFTLGNPQAGNLNAGDCPTDLGIEDLICAPCYNPTDGEPTGACEREGDMPVDPAPEPFAKCGAFPAPEGGVQPDDAPGVCVPVALIEQSGNSVDQIPQDVCPDGELCAPIGKVEDTRSCFTTCMAESIIGPAGPGTCIAPYLVEASMEGAHELIMQTSCPAGELCAPCISPLDMTSTGACDN